MPIQLLRKLPNLGRRRKRAILVAYDLAAMLVSLWASFSVRLGVLYVPTGRRVIISALIAFAVGIIALYRFRIYHIVLRYFDLRMVTRILAASAASALAWVALVYLMDAKIAFSYRTFDVPRSVAFIYCGFLFMLLFMGRYAMALLLAGAGADPDENADLTRNILIYGANPVGISLADSVRLSSRYRLAGFIDSDPAVQGQIVAGFPIYHPSKLPQLAADGEIDEVFLAMSSASRAQRLEAISQVRALDLEVKTVPAPEEIVSGRFTVSDIRPVDVSDLLRRDPVEPLGNLIQEAIEGRSILVTGAGGSIGSEICRQVLQGGPRKLVLLDHSEFALYTIHDHLTEIAELLPPERRPDVVPVVGSMLDDVLVRQLLATHAIDTLYHAAAYKHVPLLEDNELVGIQNNVFGTLTVARAAFDAKLTRFTMISTDKAVRPKSVMGATKRVAELVIQALASSAGCKTQFGIVRFGNVLDSSGSVVQRFRKQIRAGGPVTVTHRDITRFFMSIPEATQLVLQASAMARNGEVFVLDMGEPVKISELARHMINLSGMTVQDDDNPSGDVAINFVGLRPGEKLYEELFVGEETLATDHPRISMARERIIAQPELDELLAELRSAVATGDRLVTRSALREFLTSEIDAEVIEFPTHKQADGTNG
ncbi:polysaccharide biosynthesis protein [Sphingomonas sabuli]|uniref:Polysaccharide biosynthesis protein n=1 Tax=Sphingomonas sabuli TaxID=2764186 RepID=A0A7G9L456_9SPHN|nr:nucleoside-diphosphate sugar epimerase/dehydratase [Sphingomonas sabuli]QNM83405.1 polysaccharide biosynthesis protein [Sphingomonas sabuli]